MNNFNKPQICNYLLMVLTIFSSIDGTRTIAEQRRLNEHADLSELSQEENSKSPFGGILGSFPMPKYSPADPEVPYEIVPPWLDPWKEFKKKMEEEHGTSISIFMDDHHQHILNGPGARKGRNIFWWDLTIKQKLWEEARMIFKVRGGSGTTKGNIPNGITPLVGSNLSLDWMAYETELLYVANLYIEQRLLDDKLLIAAGKLAFPDYFDENKVAGWDFLSHSLARNQIFVHRYHTIGILGRYDVSEKFYIQAGVSDAQSRASETGLNTAFHDEDYFLTVGEVGFKTVNEKGLEGNYRFNLWYDPQPLNRHDGGDPERDTLGFGLSFDQMLTEKIGGFLRYGWDDGRVRTFSNYWSLGGTCKGLLPERDDDVLGLGVGQGITHQDYRRANNATHTETIFEIYYKMIIADWCWVTFDLQTLLNTGAQSSNDNAVIPGIRLTMLF
jgi:carbohydrate-selective porin OprB